MITTTATPAQAQISVSGLCSDLARWDVRVHKNAPVMQMRIHVSLSYLHDDAINCPRWQGSPLERRAERETKAHTFVTPVRNLWANSRTKADGMRHLHLFVHVHRIGQAPVVEGEVKVDTSAGVVCLSHPLKKKKKKSKGRECKHLSLAKSRRRGFGLWRWLSSLKGIHILYLILWDLTDPEPSDK